MLRIAHQWTLSGIRRASTILVGKRAPFLVYGIACLACCAFAQDDQASTGANRAAPASATRAGEIEAERQRKAASLQPEKVKPAERVLNRIEQNEIVERLTCQVTGLCVRFGGLITYSGFALGPEYTNHGLLGGAATFSTSFVGSVHEFYRADAHLNMPQLYDGFAFLDLDAEHLYYPRVDYYGSGPDSRKSGRTAYLLEQSAFQVSPGIRPIDHLRIGALGRYLLTNIGFTNDSRFAPTQEVFTEQTTPGLFAPTDFVQAGAWVQYDTRDNPGGPRSGGNYFAQYARFQDVLRDQFSFNRVDLEVQRYIGFFNHRRVIALRSRVQATQAVSGNQVPFYEQPTLGGPDDLRGFRAFRFYGNASFVNNAEYRWEVFSGLDMALFVDAGQVYNDWHQVGFRHLQTDGGFGFRFNVRNNVFLRIDTGISAEGVYVWFKFGNVF